MPAELRHRHLGRAVHRHQSLGPGRHSPSPGLFERVPRQAEHHRPHRRVRHCRQRAVRRVDGERRPPKNRQSWRWQFLQYHQLKRVGGRSPGCPPAGRSGHILFRDARGPDHQLDGKRQGLHGRVPVEPLASLLARVPQGLPAGFDGERPRGCQRRPPDLGPGLGGRAATHGQVCGQPDDLHPGEREPGGVQDDHRLHHGGHAGCLHQRRPGQNHQLPPGDRHHRREREWERDGGARVEAGGHLPLQPGPGHAADRPLVGFQLHHLPRCQQDPDHDPSDGRQ